MQFQIIPKQEHIPDFHSKDMKLKHILYYMCYDDMEYEVIVHAVTGAILEIDMDSIYD